MRDLQAIPTRTKRFTYALKKKKREGQRYIDKKMCLKLFLPLPQRWEHPIWKLWMRYSSIHLKHENHKYCSSWHCCSLPRKHPQMFSTTPLEIDVPWTASLLSLCSLLHALPICSSTSFPVHTYTQSQERVLFFVVSEIECFCNLLAHCEDCETSWISHNPFMVNPPSLSINL